jgi:hypothetical protein
MRLSATDNSGPWLGLVGALTTIQPRVNLRHLQFGCTHGFMQRGLNDRCALLLHYPSILLSESRCHCDTDSVVFWIEGIRPSTRKPAYTRTYSLVPLFLYKWCLAEGRTRNHP